MPAVGSTTKQPEVALGVLTAVLANEAYRTLHTSGSYKSLESKCLFPHGEGAHREKILEGSDRTISAMRQTPLLGCSRSESGGVV